MKEIFHKISTVKSLQKMKKDNTYIMLYANKLY